MHELLIKFWPVFLCIVMYTFMMIFFIFKGNYIYAWYWFAAMQITFASMMMAAN